MSSRKVAFTHLRRLDHVWIEPPIYFVTTCVLGRRALLANETAAKILREQFAEAPRRYGWRVGRYVIMPDHVHFFCAPGGERESVSLSQFVGRLKQGTARAFLPQLGLAAPLWQREFFDHVLRSNENYDGKWRYVFENPVRAGLVGRPDDWAFAGEVSALER